MIKFFRNWFTGLASKALLIIVLAGCITEVRGIENNNTPSSVNAGGNPTSSKKTLFYGKRAESKKYGTVYGLTETPRFAIKTNLLYGLATTLNLSTEFALEHNTTLDLSFNWNPWTYNKEENTKFKFFLFQPELRYWTCEAFKGHFFGLHGHYAYYNVGHLSNPPFPEAMNLYRFEGQLAGAGLSYGYHWILGMRWSMEAEIGAGYARLWHDKYPCQNCGKLITNEKKNYWGLTRAGINLIYIF